MAIKLLLDGLGAICDLVFPPSCAVCEGYLPPEEAGSRGGIAICAACQASLFPPRPKGRVPCGRCAAPLAPAARCLDCQRRRYRFDATLALGVYQGPLRDAVIRAKQPRDEPLTLALGDLLAEAAARWDASWDCIVPVPTHWWRRWRRGAHPAALLAERVARRLHAPIQSLLACRRATRKQGTLGPEERFANVRHAFQWRTARRAPPPRVLLVDDVMTTGATADAAAATLKRGGVKEVRVLVVARGVGGR